MAFPHFPGGEQEIGAVSKIPRSFLGWFLRGNSLNCDDVPGNTYLLWPAFV